MFFQTCFSHASLSRRFFLPFAFTLILAAAPATRAEVIRGVTTTNVFESFDSATPGTINTAVAITGLQSGESVLGIDFRPATGVLYALGSTSRLYVINTITGAATQVGSAGAFTLNGTAFGFDFNPTVDRIRVISNTGQDLRLNPNDGTLTATDTALAYAVGDANAGATPRMVGAAYTNNINGAVATTLYDIDSNLDVLTIQNPPNIGTLNTVGPLGFDTSDLLGFDISGVTGVPYASMLAPASSVSQLFTINLSTGAATLVGTIGGGLPLVDIAAPIGVTVPLPSAVGLFPLGAALVWWQSKRLRKRIDQ